jgi:hypothetical protein
MDKRKPARKQISLFSQDPKGIQWEKFPKITRQNTQRFLAQLILSVFSHNQLSQKKEHPDAVED